MELDGLRQRMAPLASGLEDLRQRVQPAEPKTTDRALNLQQLKNVQQQVAPIFVALASFVEVVEPVADKVSDLIRAAWSALQPYHPEDLFVAVYGLVLVFFGGIYMTLVASVEAAHQFGWDRIKFAGNALYHEWTKARAAFERDNKVRSVFMATNCLLARIERILTFVFHRS